MSKILEARCLVGQFFGVTLFYWADSAKQKTPIKNVYVYQKISNSPTGGADPLVQNLAKKP